MVVVMVNRVIIDLIIDLCILNIIFLVLFNGILLRFILINCKCKEVNVVIVVYKNYIKVIVMIVFFLFFMWNILDLWRELEICLILRWI